MDILASQIRSCVLSRSRLDIALFLSLPSQMYRVAYAVRKHFSHGPTHQQQRCRVFADLANAGRTYSYSDRIVYEKDMPARLLRASRSVLGKLSAAEKLSLSSARIL